MLKRFATRPTLRQLFGTRPRLDQARHNETIRLAHLKHAYALSDIGNVVALHYSTISRLVNSQET